MISIDNALGELLNRLDEIAIEHSAIFDTAVREELGWSVYQPFILGKDYDLSSQYAMLSSKAYEKIGLALLQFVKHPDVRSVNYGATTPQQRLDAFQDSSITSSLDNVSWRYFGRIETK